MKDHTNGAVKSHDKINKTFSADNLLAEAQASFSYEHLRVTKEKNIAQPEPTITIGGAAIASPGNITAIGAAAKAGKTATTSVIAAGAISVTGNIDGFPGLEVKPNVKKFAVICFDSEQSEADQQYNVITVLKRAGLENTPNYYLAYNIRQLKFSEYQTVTDAICEYAMEKHKGVHLIIIDGGADYVLSVNDEKDASMIVQYFTHLAIKYNCPVVVVVHQNPGSDKERGHFGSEIQRKCYGLLTITKEADISTLAPKIMRKAGQGDVPLINFKYCKEKGYHVSVEPPDKEVQKAVKIQNRHLDIAKKVFAPPTALTFSDAVSAIMKETSKGERTAKQMISDMKGWGYISLENDKHYRLVQ